VAVVSSVVVGSVVGSVVVGLVSGRLGQHTRYVCRTPAAVDVAREVGVR
jgi:hypothetical protein